MALIRLDNAAKAYRQLPHQTAAWSWLQNQLEERPELLEQFAELYRADPPAKDPSPSPGVDWLSLCRPLVKEFEGCRLEAYPDPGTGGDPWTIGWGHTGLEVHRGTRWSQQQADAALDADLREAHAGMLQALPMAAGYSGNRQAALTSWVFNVGTGEAGLSTLRRRLAAGEDPATVVREELPRWNKGGGGVMPGLVRRRAAEVALFCGDQKLAPVTTSKLLDVPYEYQLDNQSQAGARECFSSSCAMCARYYGKVSGDDEYNQFRARFGDTTSVGAQLKALGSLGLTAVFQQNGTAETLERLITAGQPVPVGWLHKGPVTSPTGGGHWSVVIGFDDTRFILHDPNGEAALVEGGYVSNSPAAGKAVAYSKKNFLRRWEVNGRGSGWYLDIRP